MAMLAGCSDGGDDGTNTEGTDDSDTEETNTPSEDTGQKPAESDGGKPPTESEGGQTIESMCEIQNNLSGFSVAGCQSEIADDEPVMTVTIRNDGKQEADLPAHDVGGTPYTSADTSGSPDFSYSVTANYRDASLGPGETEVVRIRNRFGPGASPTDIQHYVVTLSCGMGDDGICCK
jgi:hypothetical protein